MEYGFYMNSISQVLYKRRNNSERALIPFITAGYPSLDITLSVLHILDRQGVDVIEIGIPYSDSLADGPMIQMSSTIALNQGTYVDQVLDLLNKVKDTLNVPIVIFAYYNTILARGIQKFVEEISSRGVKGLIVPDLPMEETDYLIYLCSEYHIELILFIAPTSSKNRILSILDKAPGCIYLVGNTGVTGIRKQVNDEIINLSEYITSSTSKVVMLGFGISSVDHVKQISNWSIDGIVIGSAFIRILSTYYDGEDFIQLLISFCSSIKDNL